MSEDLGLTDAAARYRRQAIAEARDLGHTREQIAATLVSLTSHHPDQQRPGRRGARGSPATEPPKVLVQRALPTPPTVRKSVSLYLVEATRHQR
jgi:hypothetical protein